MHCVVQHCSTLVSQEKMIPRQSWLRTNRIGPWGTVIYNVLQHISSTCSLVGTRSKVYLNIAIGKKKQLSLSAWVESPYRPRGKHYSTEASARCDLSSMAQTDWVRVKF